MSIVAFWNDDKEQTGKTLASVSVATRMSMERNFKILLISTASKDPTMGNCFFEKRTEKVKGLFMGKNNSIAVENGIEGLSKLISSNKIQPNIITDYTRVVFKDRLEVLSGYIGAKDKTDVENYRDYKKISESYIELIRLANMYYDMVLVDVDNRLDPNVRKEIIEISHVNVFVLSQRLVTLQRYIDLKNQKIDVLGQKCIPVIGKYNRNSKYNKKNVMRYLGEKKDLNIIPYSTLFFEAAEEANVTEMFLKLRNIKDTNDSNYFFMEEVLKLTNNIIDRVQELQKKMR